MITPLSEHYSDEYLLQLLKNGEKLAFDALFHRYQRKAYQIAFNRLRKKEEAEEIVQEVFVNLWLKRDKLFIQTTFAAYLFTAIKYTILNYIRHESVRDKYLAHIEKELSEMDNTTQESLYANDLESSMEVAISGLSDKCQKVFRMRHQEHFSVQEIAQQLMLSPNTVKNHLSKAQKFLQSKLRAFYSLLL